MRVVTDWKMKREKAPPRKAEDQVLKRENLRVKGELEGNSKGTCGFEEKTEKCSTTESRGSSFVKG